MDHALGFCGAGIFLATLDSYYYGNRPTGLYIPRFRNLKGQDKDASFLRGYGYQTYTGRMDWASRLNKRGFGSEYKESLRKPGPWGFSM